MVEEMKANENMDDDLMEDHEINEKPNQQQQQQQQQQLLLE